MTIGEAQACVRTKKGASGGGPLSDGPVRRCAHRIAGQGAGCAKPATGARFAPARRNADATFNLTRRYQTRRQ